MVLGKELGKNALHCLTVFQHVGNAGRTSAVVFKYGIDSVTVANEVRAADMDVNVLRDVETHELGPKVLRAPDNPLWNDLLLDDPLLVVDVVQEQIQSDEALNEAAFNVLPLLRRYNARDQIKWENTLRAFVAAVDSEGNSLIEI